MAEIVVIAQPQRSVVTVQPQEILPVATKQTDRLTLLVNERGPKGDDGDADPTYIADSGLNGFRVLRVIDGNNRVAYAQPTLAGVQGIVGVSLQSVLVNATVTVRRMGEITDPSFTFTPNQPIFLTSNGFMTQVVPSSGVIQQIGYAITTTTMALSIAPPIVI